MSRELWEYLTVSSTSKRKKITPSDPEYNELSDEVREEWKSAGWSFYWWWDRMITLTFPDGKTEARVLWRTGDAENRTSFAEISNELGKDGWELVAVSQFGSGMMAEYWGFEPVSWPLEIDYLFKRSNQG